MTKFSELGIKTPEIGFIGDKVKMSRILNKAIMVHDYRIEKSNFTEKGDGNRLKLQISIGETKHVVFTGSTILKETIKQVEKKHFPFETTIIEKDECYQFT